MSARNVCSALAAPAILLMTAACVHAPDGMEDALPVAIPGEWTAGAGSMEAAVPGGAWWDSFGDPELSSLIAETLENNRDLRMAAARIDAAAAQARIAGADLLPSLGASATAARRRQNFIGFPSLGSPASGAASSAAPEVVSTTSTTLGVSLDAGWEPDLWGRIRSGTSAAAADLHAAGADYEAARLSLAGQVARTWFAIAESSRLLDLAERTVESFGRTVDQVRSRFARGLRPSLDLRLALTSLHTAEAALDQLRSQRAALVRQIEVLAGRYPEGGIERRPDLPPLPPAIPAGLPAELIGRRPDMAAAEQRLHAAGFRVTEARRSLYPRLTLTGRYGTQSERLGDLLDGDFTVWSLVAGLVQPLFQGGKLRAGVELADAREREALEGYVGAALNAYREVESALEAERILSGVESGYTAASEQALAARRLAEERYRAGLDGFLTVLGAQRRDIDAESRLISIRRLRLDTRVDLHLALGGGFGSGSIEIATGDGNS